MYIVVEFEDDGGGGVSVIRREWLTPQKNRSLWPPHKLMPKFNKCIEGSIVPDDTWKLFNVKRVFYETDNLMKAKEKEKEAELESELNSDHDKSSIRRRKKSRKIYESSDESPNHSDTSTCSIIYPTPPTKLPSAMKSSAAAGCLDSNRALKNTSAATIAQAAAARTSLTTREKRSTAGYLDLTVTPSLKETANTQALDCLDSNRALKNTSAATIAQAAAARTSLTARENRSTAGYLDLTVTPSLKETANTQALDVIAKHLASIQTDIRELQISQQEMLQRLRSCSSTPLEHSLPDGITLPCDDNEALIIIETWIDTTENRKHLATYLSLVGGNKVPAIIRRILEKLFTNRLAVQCNWTGKNGKIPLKELELIKIIRDAVRQNQIAANATDAEIHEVISNWFRFTKDRNGGREARRVKQ